MKPSPLRLDRHFVSHIHVDASPGATHKGELRVDVKPTCTQRKKDDPLQWMVSLRVEFATTGKEPPAYSGNCEFVGLFTVSDKFPKDKVEQLVRVNGASLLYAAAREMIAGITARGPWPMIILPSVSFVEPAAQSNTNPDSPAKAVTEART